MVKYKEIFESWEKYRKYNYTSLNPNERHPWVNDNREVSLELIAKWAKENLIGC